MTVALKLPTNRDTSVVKNLALPIDPRRVDAPRDAYDVSANEYGFYSVPKAFRKREVPKILAAGEVYEPNTLKFMQNMVGSGDIVTGGAFVGDFFPALSRSLAQGALLHSFEPNPITFDAARHTVALNKPVNVCLAPVAVGDAPDVLPLKIMRKGSSPLAAGARLVARLPDEIDENTVDVSVVTLDWLIPEDRNVSILHLDVEGHELPALLGAKQLIERCRPIIVLEAQAPRMRRQYGKFLRRIFPELAYRPAGVMERNIFFQPGLA